MKMEDIIQIMENRVMVLNSQKSSAYSNGDLAGVASFDLSMTETQNTITQLREAQAQAERNIREAAERAAQPPEPPAAEEGAAPPPPGA